MRPVLDSVAFAILFSVGCDPCLAKDDFKLHKPAQTGLGCLVSAYSLSTTGDCIRELELSEDDVGVLTLAATAFRQSDDMREYRRNKRFWMGQAKDVESYYNTFVNARKYVDALNANILTTIDNVLEIDRKKRRFRELLTQFCLRTGDFDGIISLHTIPLDVDKFEKLQRKITESQPGPSQYAFDLAIYRVALKMMETHAGAAAVQAAAGEEYGGQLVDGPPLPGMEDFIRRKLITNPTIHAELELTVEQVKSLTSNRRALQARGSGIESILPSEVTGIPQPPSSNPLIKELLTPKQLERFNQLVFQNYVRQLRFKQAGELAGWPANTLAKIKSSDSNWVQSEAWYEHQLESLGRNYAILESLVGNRQAARLCGKIRIAHSLFRHQDEKRDEAILQEVLARSPLPGPKPITSRRLER